MLCKGVRDCGKSQRRTEINMERESMATECILGPRQQASKQASKQVSEQERNTECQLVT